MERKTQYIVAKLEEKDLSLPRLKTKEGEKGIDYFIQQNPFAIFSGGSSFDNELIPVTAKPLRYPILLDIPAGPWSKTVSAFDLMEAQEGRFPALPKVLDPIGYAAKEYVRENEIENPNELAYDPGEYVTVLNRELIAVELYRIENRNVAEKRRQATEAEIRKEVESHWEMRSSYIGNIPNLPGSARKALNGLGIYTINDLTKVTEWKLNRTKWIGEISVSLIKTFLADRKLALA